MRAVRRGPRPGIISKTLGAALLAATLAACGDDDPTSVQLLDRDLVVGTYDPTTLTFDVTGPTFGEYDLLQGLRTEEVPPLLILSADGNAQLVFLNPSSGRFEIGEGSYQMRRDGVAITFQTATAPGQLLLPRILELTYDEDAGTLSFSSTTQVPLPRLVDLVPELEDEPLSDPVGGLLTAVFTPR